MGSYQEHQLILGKAMVKYAETFPDGLIFTRNTGVFLKQSFVQELKRSLHDLHRLQSIVGAHKQHFITISMKGQSDSYIVHPLMVGSEKFPIHIEVEVKSGEADQSKEQKNWEKACEAVGVLYILVRHEDDIVNAIQKKWPKNS